MINVRLAAVVQNVFAVVKIVSIIGVVVLGLLNLVMGNVSPVKENFLHPLSDTGSIVDMLGVAMLSALWAYDGFGDLNSAAGEVCNPGKNIPRAIVGGVLLVTLLYVLTNVAYLCVLPLAVIKESKAIAVEMSTAVIGKPGGIMVAMIVCCSAFGSLNGSILTGARVLYAAALKGQFPFSKFVGRVSQSGTPAVALVTQASFVTAFPLFSH